MGVVYEAYDRQRQEVVALKTLRQADAAAVYRLKREFRTLANVAHPNLVSLFELFAEGDEWFFTMELVEGVSFIDYVRPSVGDPGETVDEQHQIQPLHVDRLSTAFPQLAAGVVALHSAGKVHRDLKPSNVLVTSTGRVVILDLGIARDLAQDPRTTTGSMRLAGTVDYMSPEQAAGGECTAASDWYSVGVILYEALTGRLPFEGSALAVLGQKQLRDAPRIEAGVAALPVDLVELCHDLLARAPEARPPDEVIPGRLGRSLPTAVVARGGHERPRVIGRSTHLDALERALVTSHTEGTVTVYVHGLSGMGKSTIVEHFVQQVEAERRAIVLAGRCYDRESVPYKAFDGVIDSLSRHLRTLPPRDLKRILPNDAHMVARLFPVLRRVEGMSDEPHGRFESPDPVELRRRAVVALSALLGRLAGLMPLVVSVDDVQWSDADSIALGRAILSRRRAIPLLLILSFRSEEVPSHPVLQSFLSSAGTATKRELSVGPLSQADSAELASDLLRGVQGDTRALVDTIVREAAGSPFFIEQLARHVVESETREQTRTSLGDMVEARIGRLQEGARSFLQTLAVAGRPVDFAVAHRAAGLSGSAADARTLVGALRISQLIRPSGRSDQVEIYHDRIREALGDRLERSEVAAIHRRLARALAETSSGDPEALFEHYLAAGDIARAGEHAARAAHRAAEALAFDRAATLYRKAIEIGTNESSQLASWHAGLGESLANAGRPGEAANAFLEAAAREASATQALRYRRAAAEWLLIGGHNDRGLEVTRELLREVGLRMPSSSRRVLLSLLLRRLQIRLRGLGYTLRDAQRVSEIEVLRMDICWTCAIGLTMTDYIVAAYFQARYMLLALDAGEPQRVARALAFEVGFVSARGGRAARRTQRIAAEALALAERVGSPRELGMAAVTTGSAWCLLGDFERAATLCEKADAILREQCTGVQWELTTCQIFLLTSLTYLGETSEIVRRVPLLMDSARERGNLFESIELRTRQNLYWLLCDDPATAGSELADAMAQWSRKGFYRQDYNRLLAQTQIDLYLGQPTVAWARLAQAWPALRSSQLLRVQLFLAEALYLRARAAIAAARRGHDVPAMLRRADRDARRIAREKMPWCVSFDPLLRAGIAAVQGNSETAAHLLAKSVAGFEAAKMRLFAAAARRRLGETIGGDEGAGFIQEADSFMRRQSIRSPERMTNMLVPGFGRSAS
jgi:serine/threonine protein kinase